MARRRQPDAELTPTEQTSLLVLNGQLLWVAQHIMPLICAPLSYLLADNKRGTVASLQESNILLKIAQEHRHEGLHFYCHTGACVAAWSDAAHASRRDLSSQGGSLIALTDPCFPKVFGPLQGCLAAIAPGSAAGSSS